MVAKKTAADARRRGPAAAKTTPAKRPFKQGDGFTQKLADEICERISNGETLRAICREVDKPSFFTVYKWLRANEEFKAAFDAARDVGFDVIAQECLAIADDASEDYVMGKKGPVFDKEHVMRARLKVETRLKLLAKWSQRYSEKVAITDPDGGPVKAQTVVGVYLPDNGRG